MELKLKAVTFYNGSPEVAELRPAGVVQLIREPDNKADKDAIAVLYKGIQIGYLPKGTKTDATYAEIIDYAYWDESLKWNTEHMGRFQSMKMRIKQSEQVPTKGGKIYGGRYLRVTAFLKYFDSYGGGDGLIKWAFKQAVGESYKEYDLDWERLYDGYRVALDEVCNRGTAMHDAIECALMGTDHDPSLLPAGWDTFLKKYEPEVLYMEERFRDNTLMVTGQPDFVGYVNYKRRRVLAVLDWKSSREVNDKHRLQISIYAKNVVVDGVNPEIAMVVAFGAENRQKFSASVVRYDQVIENYLACRHIRKAMDVFGVRLDESSVL